MWRLKNDKILILDKKWNQFISSWVKKFKNKAINIVDDYFFNDEVLTFDDFEKQLLCKEYDDTSFFDFVLDELPKKNFSSETMRTYSTQISKLQKFKKLLFLFL